MLSEPQNLKAERVQVRHLPITSEDLRNPSVPLDGWQIDSAPNAIVRHFPQSSFAASAVFLSQIASQVEAHGRTPYVFVDATGVTVRLGNPPMSGVTSADLDFAVGLITLR